MNDSTQLSRKKRCREFTGCWQCRSRKVKCAKSLDTSLPCSACERLGLACDGSSSRLVWLNGNKSYRSNGRRFMHCERTWENRPPLASDSVDLLISQCDSTEDIGERYLMDSSHNPFSVFPIRVENLLFNGGEIMNHATKEDQFLFHHYVDYVASIMVPFENPHGPSNPWKVFYPCVSLRYLLPGEKALYHAIIAHSAFNLANLGPDNASSMRLRSATKHYNISIQYVNESIGSVNRDSASTLAAIMTLMMAEVYSGQSKKWKHHLQGAWALLLDPHSFDSWDESPFTRFSIQSLLIVRIISGTALGGGESHSHDLSLQHTSSEPNFDSSHGRNSRDLSLISSILSTSEFGFTIGAHKSLLECISSITEASHKMQLGITSEDSFKVDITIARVLSCLEDIRTQLEGNNLAGTEGQNSESLARNLARYQLSAFLYATYIYLYRSLLHVPPRRVAKYVELVFSNTQAFYSEDRGNFSLWPAFIAAVEAYTESDIGSAKEWLEQSSHFGLGNRRKIKHIVEYVWRKRDRMHLERNMDKGLVAIDWREIGLDTDILLV